MTQYGKEELVCVVQMLLAIFISFTLIRFLSVFAINFNPYAAFGVIAGAAILYLCLKRGNHFNQFFGYACLMAVPFSILFAF